MAYKLIVGHIRRITELLAIKPRKFSGKPPTNTGRSCVLEYSPPKRSDEFIKRTANIVVVSFLAIALSRRVASTSDKNSSAALVSSKE